MKKIKLIVYHPYSNIGGADISLKRLLDNLDVKKFSITFISLNQSILKKDLKNKVEFINLNCSRAFFSIFKLRKIVENFNNLDKFSKVIVFSNQNFANIITFFSLIKMNNVKKIFIERNHLEELNQSNNLLHKLKNIILKILIKLFYRYSDLVIGISKKLSHDLSKFCKVKVKTIYSPAYDLSIFKAALKQVKLSKKINYVINVSRFTKRKDHFTTLYAFKLALKKIKNLNLILVGYGPEYENIKFLINKFKIQNKVLIVKNNKIVYPYIKKSDLLILSSKYEGMGNVLVEAIALGTPVISSNCKSGPSEILLNGKGGDLFKPTDYKNLSKKIINFFENKKILLMKLKKAQKKLDRFNLKTHVKIYTKIFSEI